ncbi:MAG: protein phosphatase 2C domain-containing protein [Mycoplasma sp.]
MDKQYRHGNLSDIGSVRQNNEDYAWSGINEFGIMAGVVCDGLGGYKGGSAASEITVKVFQERFLKTNFTSYQPEQVSKWIENTIEAARVSISEHIIEHEKLSNMATTFVASIIIGNVCYIFNIGDSRAWYVSREGKGSQITIDQNLLNHLNQINAPRELYEKHKASLFAITQFVGARTDREIKAEGFYQTIKKGDFIVLTSDGCHNFVTIEDIVAAIDYDIDKLPNACNAIITKALVNNSNDNLSIVILGV